MNKMCVLQKEELRGELDRRIYLLITKNPCTRLTIGASIGLAGGLMSIILGALLWAVVQLLAPGSFGSFLNSLEIVFFVLALPLLALGAYCLDLLEKRPSILSMTALPRPDGSARWHRLRVKHPNKN